MKRFLALLVVIAAAVAAAAFTVPSNAATVNGQSISETVLNSELQAIAASPRFQCLQSAVMALTASVAGSTPPLHGVGENTESGENGTYSSAFVDYWLGTMIRDQLISQYLGAHHLVVSAQGLALAKQEMTQAFYGEIQQVQSSLSCAGHEVQADGGQGNIGSATLAELPASFLATLVRNQADQDVMQAAAAGYGINDASFERYFSAHTAQFDTICVSDIVVASQSQAQTLLAQINGGTSFATVAKANSLDSNTAPNGGAIPCGPLVDYASIITTGTAGLTDGQVSQPVSYNGAYVLFQLNSRVPSKFSTVKFLVEGATIESGSQQYVLETDHALLSAKVEIAPKYGSWNARSVGVVAPLTPPQNAVLSIPANVPTTSSPTPPTSSIPGSTG